MLHCFEFCVDAIEHFVSINEFSELGRLPILFDLLSDLFFVLHEKFIALDEELQGLANHLARGLVTARLNLALNELLNVRSQVNGHSLSG